ncbi:MAG: hypothetical protein QME96_12930, partial [Myxococcota bacterium]|nr:hypothetical protein [Myxococcota bacterium]
ATIRAALAGRSVRSVYRDLTQLGYMSSFTDRGRFYTLASIPDFDDDGLWFHEGVGFSRVGTLKETVVALVEKAEAGRTHRELEAMVRVRVHNTLLQLVQEARIRRERLEQFYLYVSAQDIRRAEQVARRRTLVAGEAVVALPTEMVIAVLVEALRASEGLASASVVAVRLSARGTAATGEQVTRVYTEYGLVPGKKTEGPPSGHSQS